MLVSLIATGRTKDGAETTLDFHAVIDKANKGKIVGTLLNELYIGIDILRQNRCKNPFGANELTHVKLIFGDIVLDSSKIVNPIAKGLTMRLNLRHTASERTRYAKLVYSLCEYMTREVVQLEWAEFIAQWEAKAYEEKIESVQLKEVNELLLSELTSAATESVN